MARLEELYKDDISKSLLSKLNYKSKMEVPYIEKNYYKYGPWFSCKR